MDGPGLFRLNFKSRFLSLVLSGCLVLLGLTCAWSDNGESHGAVPTTAQDGGPVIIEQNKDWNATLYRFSEGDCTIEWIAWNTEIGVVKHESDCASPLALQMPLLAKIVETFLRSDPNAGSLRTLFWSRIEPDNDPGAHELSCRLALAAYKSPGWDKKRGKAKNGDINGLVKDLANTAMIYPELRDLFARFNKHIFFSCAEKVLVTKAGNLPFFDQLKQHGIKATDRLPFDCMAWFSISDLTENSPH